MTANDFVPYLLSRLFDEITRYEYDIHNVVYNKKISAWH